MADEASAVGKDLIDEFSHFGVRGKDSLLARADVNCTRNPDDGRIESVSLDVQQPLLRVGFVKIDRLLLLYVNIPFINES